MLNGRIAEPSATAVADSFVVVTDMRTSTCSGSRSPCDANNFKVTRAVSLQSTTDEPAAGPIGEAEIEGGDQRERRWHHPLWVALTWIIVILAVAFPYP